MRHHPTRLTILLAAATALAACGQSGRPPALNAMEEEMTNATTTMEDDAGLATENQMDAMENMADVAMDAATNVTDAAQPPDPDIVKPRPRPPRP